MALKSLDIQIALIWRNTNFKLKQLENLTFERHKLIILEYIKLSLVVNIQSLPDCDKEQITQPNPGLICVWISRFISSGKLGKFNLVWRPFVAYKISIKKIWHKVGIGFKAQMGCPWSYTLICVTGSDHVSYERSPPAYSLPQKKASTFVEPGTQWQLTFQLSNSSWNYQKAQWMWRFHLFIILILRVYQVYVL